MVLHVPPEGYKLQLVQDMLKWTTKSLRTGEIDNKLLLVTDTEGRMILHMAAKGGKIKY